MVRIRRDCDLSFRHFYYIGFSETQWINLLDHPSISTTLYEISFTR